MFFFPPGLNFLQHLKTSPESYAHFTLSGDYYNRELSGEIPGALLFSYLSLGNSLFYYRKCLWGNGERLTFGTVCVWDSVILDKISWFEISWRDVESRDFADMKVAQVFRRNCIERSFTKMTVLQAVSAFLSLFSLTVWCIQFITFFRKEKHVRAGD